MLGLWAVVTLVTMAVVLIAGYWKPHPLLSLLVPVVALTAWLPIIRDRRVERWIFFYVAGLYVYTVLRSYADETGLPIQVDYVIAAERLLFQGSVPSVELQRSFFSPRDLSWLDGLTTLVHASFFIVPHAAAFILWRRRPRALATYVGCVLLTLYIGLLLFFLLPTVPPWLAAHQGELERTYRVIDFVFSGIDRDMYRSVYETLGEPNDVASVPSIHMALTCVVLLRARDIAPRLVWPLVAYNVLMAFSLIYLGEHYAFDVAAGVLVAVVADRLLRAPWRGRNADGAGSDLLPPAPDPRTSLAG